MAKKYKALVGMNYPGRRIEAGEIVDDIPPQSIPDLVHQGSISEDLNVLTIHEQIVLAEAEQALKERGLRNASLSDSLNESGVSINSVALSQEGVE
jgi:hypothetical protein